MILASALNGLGTSLLSFGGSKVLRTTRRSHNGRKEPATAFTPGTLYKIEPPLYSPNLKQNLKLFRQEIFG
jgi:hypothetical protein